MICPKCKEKSPKNNVEMDIEKEFIDYPMSTSPDATIVSEEVKIYVCPECGYYELVNN